VLQGEYRFALITDPDFGRRIGLGFNFFAVPELVVFADAGRAWIEARSLDGRNDLGPRSLQSNVGVGLRMGPLGMYIAAPLSGGGRNPNFFVRLGPRL
jgi:outer membrane protein assembly factor BamA